MGQVLTHMKTFMKWDSYLTYITIHDFLNVDDIGPLPSPTRENGLVSGYSRGTLDAGKTSISSGR